jgi:hypothetical protein
LFYKTSDFVESFRHTKAYDFNQLNTISLKKDLVGSNSLFFLNIKKSNKTVLDKNNHFLNFLVIKQKRLVIKFFNLKIFDKMQVTPQTIKSSSNYFTTQSLN